MPLPGPLSAELMAAWTLLYLAGGTIAGLGVKRQDDPDVPDFEFPITLVWYPVIGLSALFAAVLMLGVAATYSRGDGENPEQQEPVIDPEEGRWGRNIGREERIAAHNARAQRRRQRREMWEMLENEYDISPSDIYDHDPDHGDDDISLDRDTDSVHPDL